MTKAENPLWTLGELADRVAASLAHDYAGAPNQRVRDVPDPRVIRYYTTLGLIDRAAAMRGRTALYGRRHLLQVVAIKRLQAEGLSIAQIQARLAGLPDADLAGIARLPEDAADVAVPLTQTRTRRAFWKEPVAAEPAAPAPKSAKTLQGVQLAPGVTLLVDSTTPLSAVDVAALETAAQPLLQVLAAQGLVLTTIEGSPR